MISAKTDPPNAACGAPRKNSAEPACLNADVAVLEISAIVPTHATIGDGATAKPDFDWLYRLTLPETNGVPSMRAAWDKPSTAATNSPRWRGSVGSPKF